MLVTFPLSSCYSPRRVGESSQGQFGVDFPVFFGFLPTQDVAMILLQILDEGTITDSQGRKVDFKVPPLSHDPEDRSFE